MRGSLVVAARDYVRRMHTPEAWGRILERAGIPPSRNFMPLEDVEDAAYLAIVDALAAELKMPKKQVWEALADFWINDHTKRTVPFHYQTSGNAREFLLRMDQVHATVSGAARGQVKPPSFEFHEAGPDALEITYVSERGLLDYLQALIRAVGKFYGQTVQVKLVGDNRVHVAFPKQ